MEEQSAIVKFSSTFSGPEYGTAFGEISLCSFGTCTKTAVDIFVNPGVLEHRPEVVHTSVGQFAGFNLMTGVESQTTQLSFDISSAPMHSVTFNDHDYEIRLLNIQEVADELPNSFQYEFMVTKRSTAGSTA